MRGTQVERSEFLELWALVQNKNSDVNFRHQRWRARNEIEQRHGELTIIKDTHDPVANMLPGLAPRLFILTFYMSERGKNTKVIDRYSTYEKAYAAWRNFEEIKP
jgi:hypothetical protein